MTEEGGCLEGKRTNTEVADSREAGARAVSRHHRHTNKDAGGARKGGVVMR